MNIGADNAYLRFVIMFILMSITPDLDTLSENLSGINHYGHVNISWFALVSCVLGWLWPFRYFVTGGNGSLSTTSNIVIISHSLSRPNAIASNSSISTWRQRTSSGVDCGDPSQLQKDTRNVLEWGLVFSLVKHSRMLGLRISVRLEVDIHFYWEHIYKHVTTTILSCPWRLNQINFFFCSRVSTSLNSSLRWYIVDVIN